MSLLLDANAWIYYLDARSPEHGRARRRLPDLLSKNRIVVPAITQMEVLHHVRLMLKGTSGEAMHEWIHLDADRPDLDAGIVEDAFHLLAEHADRGLGGRDAALLVHSQRAEATLLTNDRSLLRIAAQIGVATRAWTSLR